ncbi:MAG: hypothetical protein PHV11_08750 [Candidatus Bipolaricaulis sp.]|nr:hypothetical protein [Candidatus Bipolaricaulis sp.]MDD5220641.1 hypothetical protein [Candidatus Bipolaricaulis sp.]MDD5647248.1 hypothetical protein [Candidatus Bipolaricaulis sp.]
MEKGKRIAVFGLAGLLVVVALVGVGQGVSAPRVDSSQVKGAFDQVLTFVDSVSTYLGQGMLYIVNLITNDRVSPDLEKPLGYMAFITVLLLLFGLIEFARKIIWIGLIVGWVLIIVRIVLDALKI